MKRMMLLLLVAALLAGCAPGKGAAQVVTTSAPGVMGPPDPSAAPAETETPETAPPQTTTMGSEPLETEPAETLPAQTQPKTEPVETVPAQTRPAETPAETVPETTVLQTEETTTVPSAPALPTEEFKRQVEHYATVYINQYRAQSGVQICQVLPGMTLVAQMRASQLTYNFSHSTADKRAALAYYQYGRWIDATEFGGDPEDSYYEADSAEAICAGFRGVEAEAMGKRIADMIYGSASHWSYVGSSEYSYIAVGVEYRGGTAYDWYGCVMVGKVNYG